MSTSSNPHPVHDPRHNLRELVKECILLERHLFDPTKYCKDCIRKHFLTIEAFAGPELGSLDIEQKYLDIISRLSNSVPNWTCSKIPICCGTLRVCKIICGIRD